MTFIINRLIGGLTARRNGHVKNRLSSAMMMILTAFMAASMTSCAVISKFDQNSYDSALALKSESLALIEKANEPATQHAAEIDALKVKLSAQLAYQDGKGKNNILSAKQWLILVSEDHDLLGKFLKDWVGGKTFYPKYIIEKRQQISDAFDQCIRLEAAKIKD